MHPELESRVPLLLSDYLIGSDLKLKKFGVSVKIVPDKEIGGPFIRFTYFDCAQSNYCSVAFEYPVEGVTGGLEAWHAEGKKVRLEKVEIRER